MPKKILWVALTCLIVVGLVLASCGPAEEAEEEGKTVVGTVEEEEEEEEEEVAEGAEMVRDTLGRLMEKPQYGGIITVMRNADPRDFDEAFANTWGTWTLGMTNDPLICVDWSKGPSGTGEADIMKDCYYPSFTEYLKPHLCESFEFPEPGTHVYNIRKGIYFQDKPPVNGREMTAEDVLYSIKRMYEMPGSWVYQAHAPVSYETPDKYTLVLKFPDYNTYDLMRCASITYTVPQEVAEMDDGEGLRNWENACGTGPYMLIDYVIGNSLTFDRNPNYWEFDPFLPDNRLPYADNFKVLIIPDQSTQLAALRTGKIDTLYPIRWEQRESLMETNPELKQRAVTGAGSSWYLPCNVEPYSDINVRRALSMAIDRDVLIDDFYHGEAERLAWVVLPENPEYTPFEDLPADTKESLEYHPDRAQQLLAEAGYPNGFKMELICTSTTADLASLCEAMWEQIGLDVELDVLETAVFTSTLYAHEYTDPIFGGWLGQYIEGNLDYCRTDMPNNHTLVNNPEYDEMAADLLAEFDPDVRLEKATAINLYCLDKSYLVPLPSGSQWIMWQPWLKRYSGEVGMGYCHWWKPLVYAWVDQDMK
jgi:peptide/nickel transport system substrate-binding protein